MRDLRKGEGESERKSEDFSVAAGCLTARTMDDIEKIKLSKRRGLIRRDPDIIIRGDNDECS
jgi:hypothetical protein